MEADKTLGGVKIDSVIACTSRFRPNAEDCLVCKAKIYSQNTACRVPDSAIDD